MSENDLMFMPDSMIAGMLMHISLEMHHNHRALIDEARRRLAVRHELNRIAQQQRWIPVEERLPETRGPVLTLWVSGMQSVKQYDEQHGWNTGAQVTHWMPLPEPPEALP
jgi:hypothetical protein